MKFSKRVLPGLGLVVGIGLLAGGASAASTPSVEPNGAIMGAGQQSGANNATPSTQSGNTAANPHMASSNNAGSANAKTGQMSGGDSAKAGEMSSNGQNGSALDEKTVRQVQQSLKLKTDGVWGPGTEAALKKYQQENGLPATGQLDQATRQKLNLQG